MRGLAIAAAFFLSACGTDSPLAVTEPPDLAGTWEQERSFTTFPLDLDVLQDGQSLSGCSLVDTGSNEYVGALQGSVTADGVVSLVASWVTPPDNEEFTWSFDGDLVANLLSGSSTLTWVHDGSAPGQFWSDEETNFSRTSVKADGVWGAP